MSNEKLYGSMLKCDGTTKNCEGCLFRKVPDCRNAMAHHAGAMIQLQEVVLDNVGAQSAAQEAEIRELQRKNRQLDRVNQDLCDGLRNIRNGLKELRHCASCEYNIPQKDEMEESARKMVCAGCHEEHSNWEPWVDFGKPPADPCEDCEGDDCEGCEFNPDNE